MPVHDWTRVDAGTFHGFHTAWVTHLSESLNGGILPAGYYAMPEQHLGRSIGDVLTLHTGKAGDRSSIEEGGLALADAPPRVGHKFSVTATPRSLRRTLAIRSASDHQIIALVEIVSPANKDRTQHVDDFAAKVAAALANGIHALLIDLFPTGPHDPHGMHGAVWQQLDEDAEVCKVPAESPLTLAAYVVRSEIEAYVEHLAVGAILPAMPLFLSPARYVNAPLESTYMAAFNGLPAVWRSVLESA
jgi:Protein of unknown function (DUF4058)